LAPGASQHFEKLANKASYPPFEGGRPVLGRRGRSHEVPARAFTKMQLRLAAVEIISESAEKAGAVHDSLMHPS
jgi:hypothetical protein